MADRLFEHPATVLVVTNLYYAEAPWLRPRDVKAAAALNWKEVPLEGGSAQEYGEPEGTTRRVRLAPQPAVGGRVRLVLPRVRLRGRGGA